MKRIFIATLIVVAAGAVMLESCHKPPASTGHKSFRSSKRNR